MEANTDRSGWSVAALIVVGIVIVFFRTELEGFITSIFDQFTKMIEDTGSVLTAINLLNPFKF